MIALHLMQRWWYFAPPIAKLMPLLPSRVRPQHNITARAAHRVRQQPDGTSPASLVSFLVWIAVQACYRVFLALAFAGQSLMILYVLSG